MFEIKNHNSHIKNQYLHTSRRCKIVSKKKKNKNFSILINLNSSYN